MRHGKTKRYEACVYCGKHHTKLYGGRPICKTCWQMVKAGIPPR